MPVVRSIPQCHHERTLRDGSYSVCRLARSKSSALGAENRRFKSCHTDNMGVTRNWRRLRLTRFVWSAKVITESTANAERDRIVAEGWRPEVKAQRQNATVARSHHVWKVGRAVYRTGPENRDVL